MHMGVKLRWSMANCVSLTIPCHLLCMKLECFNAWRSAVVARSYRNGCKCPLCNVPSMSFVKIFLAAPEGIGGDDGDDDSSLSSCSTVEDTPMEDDEDDSDAKNEGQDDSEKNESSYVADAKGEENNVPTTGSCTFLCT